MNVTGGLTLPANMFGNGKSGCDRCAIICLICLCRLIESKGLCEVHEDLGSLGL